MLEDRLRAQLKLLRNTHAAKRKLDTKGLKRFLAEQEMFVKRTNDEIVEDEKVAAGHIERINAPDAELEQADETMRSAKRVKAA